MCKKNCFTTADKLGLLQHIKDKDVAKNTIYPCGIFELLGLSTSFTSNDKSVHLETMEDLLKRDEQRVKDGFPKKIKVKRIPYNKGKMIIIPTTDESKLVHGNFEPGSGKGEGTGGKGEGEEGDVIGQKPVEGDGEEGEEGDDGAGKGGGGNHGIGTDAYEIGKKLTEELGLPNLKDKGKKVAVDKFIYDLTNRNVGSGQVLDKKATIKRVIRTNRNIGHIPDLLNIDTTKLLVGPKDRVYRVLSKEKEYESQALVFFLRDYSGSMYGKPTEGVVNQHLMIYSWLMFQYGERVKSRFILHDTEAKEVPNFEAYYKSIYVFHGTDGDNWGDDDEKFIEELKKIMEFSNRTGISIVKNSWWWGGNDDDSSVSKAVKKSGILEDKVRFRMFLLKETEVNEQNNLKAVKHLISE